MAQVKEHKIVVVGSGSVGKSALTIQFVQKQFVPYYDPTIEDSYQKPCTIEDVTCMLNILDTAGQQEFISMREQYLQSGEGFLLVYAITVHNTFEEIASLRDHILRVKDAESAPMVIVGNKCDLEKDREVQTDDGKALAKNYGVPFFETSAKDRINVTECFHELVREIWRAEPKDSSSSSPTKRGWCALF
eukprot:gnl/Dysnectes_brevis/505_a559_6895.p1 GENE.gnl/Dysnectes_brevis/505_a559_6895~~gnl/Dysnectes_brevis/505_a559_6895.p1  ORF type:complete len:202 (-),score=14.57 gnl/Dysnectes_brevis/505_a559_6895:65-634(-)